MYTKADQIVVLDNEIGGIARLMLKNFGIESKI